MSAVIGALRGLLSLDTAAFDSGAKRAVASMGNLERRMAAAGKRMERVGRGLTVGVTLPMAAMATVAIRSSLKTIDAQAKLAQSFGTTVKSMQVLDRAADLSGVSMGEVQQATLQLTKRLSEVAEKAKGPTAEALDRLRLKAAALQKLPLDERLSAIQNALAAYVPEAERAAVASDLFGSRAGLIFTRIDSDTLRTATDDIKRFGIAVSEIEADQIERTNDAISRLGLIGRGVANQLTAALAPTLEALAGKAAEVADWFNNLSDRGQRMTAAIAAIAVAAGPAAIAIGLILQGLGPMSRALVAVAAAARTAAVAVWAMTGPWGILAALVAGSAAYFLIFAEKGKTAESAAKDAASAMAALNGEMAIFHTDAAPSSGAAAIEAAGKYYQLAKAAREAASAELAVMTAQNARYQGMIENGNLRKLSETEQAIATERLASGQRALIQAQTALAEADRRRKQTATEVMRGLSAASAAQDKANKKVEIAIDGLGGLGGAAKGAGSEIADLSDKLAGTGPTALSSAIDGVSNAWGEFVVSGFKKFDDFKSSVIDSFKGMLAQMISLAAKNRISVGLGLSVAGGAGSSAAAGGSSGGGLLGNVIGGKLLSGGGLLGGLSSGFGLGVSSLLSSGISGYIGTIGAQFSAAMTGSLSAIGGLVGALGPIAIGIGVLAKGLSRKYAGTIVRGDITPEGFSGTQDQFFKGGFLRSDKTVVGQVAPEIQELMDQTIQGVTSSLEGMAETLNLSSRKIKGFSAQFGLWINDLTPEQIQEEIAKQLDAAAEGMAQLILKTERFTRSGESALETLNRLSTSLVAVNDVMDILGHRLFEVSLRGADAASELVDLFGGLEVLQAASSAYLQGFYSEQERVGIQMRRLTERFGELGYVMPQSRAAFREMVEAIDLTSTSGRTLYAELLKMSEALDQVLPQIAEMSIAVSEMMGGIRTEILARIDAAQELSRASEQAAALWYRTATTLRGFLRDLTGDAALSPLSDRQQLGVNRARFNAAADKARGGDVTAAGDIPALAKAYLASLSATSSTAAEYKAAAGEITGQVKFLAGISELEGANQDVLETLYQKQIEVLTSLGNFLQLEGLTNDQIASLDQSVGKLVKDWDGTVAQFDGVLGDLASAITEAQNFSYDKLLADLDIAISLKDKTNVPKWLQEAITQAGDGIRTTLDFIIRRNDLTPDMRWIAVNSVSEHIKSLDFILRKDVGNETRRLALETASELRRNIRLILTRDLDVDTRRIALAGNSELSRVVNVALDRAGSDRKALHLALANIRDYAVLVSASLSTSIGSKVRKLVFDGSGAYAAMIEATLVNLQGAARRILLAQQGDYVTNIRALLAADMSAELRRVLLNKQTEAIRKVTIDAVFDGKLSDADKALLRVISGKSTGVITLGGSFKFLPDQLFDVYFTQFETGTSTLSSSMDSLRKMLDSLRAAVAADTKQRADTLKLAGLQTQGAKMADVLAQRQERSASIVSQIKALEASTGVTLKNGSGAALLKVNPDGTISYKATDVEYSAGSNLDAFAEAFWSQGGLQDQIYAKSEAVKAAMAKIEGLRSQVVGLNGTPAFAAGGAHSGGWRVVGERGWELENTGPSRVVSNADARSMLDNSAVVAEQRRTREINTAMLRRMEAMATEMDRQTQLQRSSDRALRKLDAEGILSRT